MRTPPSYNSLSWRAWRLRIRLRAVRRSVACRIAASLFTHLFESVAGIREPDFVVGSEEPAGAYLRRWYVIPRNRVLNVYLHQFLRDDDDRALHDHPWAWCSFLLKGAYREHTIRAGGIETTRIREAGSIKVSLPTRAHRISLFDHQDDPRQGKDDCWTLFVTGPRVRRWGFHCPRAGWVDFERFTKPDQSGEIGKGCDG